RVDGMNTLVMSATTINWNSSSYNPTLDPYDLLAGLPYDTMNLPDCTAGWHRNPTSDITVDFNTNWFRVYTNGHNCDPRGTRDIVFQAAQFATPTVPVNYTLSHAITRNKSGAITLLLAVGVGYLWGGFTVYKQIFPYRQIQILKNEYVGGSPTTSPRYTIFQISPRLTMFQTFSPTSDVVMVGDSLTSNAAWTQIFPKVQIANRGIGGDTTDDILLRMQIE